MNVSISLNYMIMHAEQCRVIHHLETNLNLGMEVIKHYSHLKLKCADWSCRKVVHSLTNRNAFDRQNFHFTRAPGF